MRDFNLDRLVPASLIAVVLGAALIGAAMLSPMGMHVAQAQTEPPTAANGVLLPPPDFDPVAARGGYLIESAVAASTSTAADSTPDGSTTSDAPESVADAPDAAAADGPENGNSATTTLGGADVAVSSVGGSNEVDSPKKRSNRKK